MNERFFALPPEKRRAIINAGYRVFSRNSYKKSPVGDIAAEAGISKSLLFHYFANKKELYLFLWEYCAKTTIKCLREAGCYGQIDLFESMRRGLAAQVQLIRKFPDMGAFVMRAYYETDPDICDDVKRSIDRYVGLRAGAKLMNLDPAQLRPGVDIQMMYQEMYWASVGYLWDRLQRGPIDPDAMERDFLRMLAHWEAIYRREDDTNASD